MEGIPKKKLIPRSGTEYDRYPVYDRVPVDEEVESEEVLEIPADEAELIRQNQLSIEHGRFDPKPDRAGLRNLLGALGLVLVPADNVQDVEASSEVNTLSPDYEHTLRVDTADYDKQIISGQSEASVDWDKFESAGKSSFSEWVDELVAEIDQQDIEKTIKRAKAFDEKLGMSLGEYINTNFSLRDKAEGKKPAVPKDVVEFLRPLQLGKAIQESRLDPEAANGIHKGLFQFRNAVVNDYMKVDQVPTDPATQVRLNNEHTSDGYFYIQEYAGADMMRKLRQAFNSELEFSKLEGLLTALGHNFGGPATGELVRDYLEEGNLVHPHSGEETFMDILKWGLAEGKLKKENYDYAAKNFAWAKIAEKHLG